MSEQDFLGIGGGGNGNVNADTDNGGLVFDLTDVKEETGFEVIPKGTYPAIMDELDFGDSNSGNPMFTAVFKITEGEFEGRKVYDYWVLGGNGAEFGQAKLKKWLSRCMPETPLSGFKPQEFADSGVAIGRECQIALTIKTQTKGEYKGEKRNQVKDILPPSNGSFI